MDKLNAERVLFTILLLVLLFLFWRQFVLFAASDLLPADFFVVVANRVCLYFSARLSRHYGCCGTREKHSTTGSHFVDYLKVKKTMILGSAYLSYLFILGIVMIYGKCLYFTVFHLLEFWSSLDILNGIWLRISDHTEVTLCVDIYGSHILHYCSHLVTVLWVECWELLCHWLFAAIILTLATLQKTCTRDLSV